MECHGDGMHPFMIHRMWVLTLCGLNPKHLDFDAGAALEVPGQGVRPGHEVLEAIDFLRAIERRRTDISPEEVHAAFLTSAWHRRVFPKRGEHAGTFDKQAYTLAAMERLRESLRRHEVFVPGLRKWGPHRRTPDRPGVGEGPPENL